MDEETRNELRRKKISFTSKEPWEPGHRCLGKGKIHYIEVLPNSDSESDTTQPPSKELSIYEEAPPLKATRKPLPRIEGGTIAILSGVPKYHTFKIKGAIQG